MTPEDHAQPDPPAAPAHPLQPWGSQLTPYGAGPSLRPVPPPRLPWPYLAAVVILAVTTLVVGLEALSEDHAVGTAQHQRDAAQAAQAADHARADSVLATVQAQLLLARNELAAGGQHDNEVYAAVAACAAGVTLALTEQNAGNQPAAAVALTNAQPVCVQADQMARPRS